MTMEFAEWLNNTAPRELIVRIDVERHPQGTEQVNAAVLGCYGDDEGHDCGLIRIRAGFYRQPDVFKYYRWRRAHSHGLWAERGLSAHWPTDWKFTQPVAMRYRTSLRAATGNPDDVTQWRYPHHHNQEVIQYARWLHGVITHMQSTVSSGGSPDSFVIPKILERLRVLIAQGNREFSRLTA